MSRWWLRISLALLAACGLSTAWAHELSMAEMELREVAPGQFTWMWTASGGRLRQ